MLNFKAKKSLGQNFLKSGKSLNQIIDTAKIEKEDLILEIGPGKGALTKKLLETGAKIIAIEKDKRSVAFLKEKFKKEIENQKFILLEEDVLNFDERRCGDDRTGYKIVANIPYYITGEILRKFLSSENQPKSMTLLVQKEVAERIVTRNNKESILSISVKIFGDPKYIATVKKESFSPKPKVDSAILHISNISKKHFLSPPLRGGEEKDSLSSSPFHRGEKKSFPRRKNEEKDSLPLPSSSDCGGEEEDCLSSSPRMRGSHEYTTKEFEEKFFQILKAGFAHKRKLLISNLKNEIPAFAGTTGTNEIPAYAGMTMHVHKTPAKAGATEMEDLFGKCNIKKDSRAEDLTLEQWVYLTEKY